MHTNSFSRRTRARQLIKWQGIFLLLFTMLIVNACSSGKSSSQEQKNSQSSKMMEAQKGTFGYDVNFLKKYTDVIVLSAADSSGKLVVTPTMQGRVMTSTVSGDSGKSLGWVNRDLIASGKIKPHFTPYGGEDRFWIGPEGGQYSVFIKPGKKMVFDNWYVPAGFNTEDWTLKDKSKDHVTVTKQLKLQNYSKTDFTIDVNRRINLFDKATIAQFLDIQVPSGVKFIGYESKNTITNAGDQPWTRQGGAVSIWILSQFNPAPGVTVAIPFKQGSESELGSQVVTAYFGDISSERLRIKDGMIYFKMDGKKRRKLGLPPKRAKGLEASYDASNNILTIMQFKNPTGDDAYMNQLWKQQEHPYQGEAEFAYNDGPLEDGSQLGPFYEMESASPAAFLAPNESLTHNHRVFHFSGSEQALDKISQSILGVGLQQIKSAFK